MMASQGESDPLSPSPSSGGFYDSRAWRDYFESQYPGQVTSSTIPPRNAKMVGQAGLRHPETGVVYSAKGLPVFDDVAVFQTRIPRNIASIRDPNAHKRAATRSLRESIDRGESIQQFTPEQMDAIRAGRAQIPGFIWHHHEDIARMQLVPREFHERTGHAGGEYIWFGEH
jgi:hypothetical protein